MIYRYDIEKNGWGLALIVILFSPIVLWMFGYAIEWWNR